MITYSLSGSLLKLRAIRIFLIIKKDNAVVKAKLVYKTTGLELK
ncbi:MAG: hypothetical protein ACFFAI_14525 [Promethearchaeota archaeon]